MSFRENVSVSIRSLTLLGIWSSGTERTFHIANHAPVFMVGGLHRKWKEPVSYYLNHGSTKANLLVKFLNGVLSACQNAGLHVVATICDTVANNVKALKLVCYQTEAILQVPEPRYCDCDPPHLKCTRTMFLKYNVQLQFEFMCNHFATASWWEHIVNEYKWDKQNIVSHIYKLIGAHLSPAAQSAMKVSLAAQMIEHTVEASLNAATFLGKEHCSAFIVLY
jgi:hypothetical protein